MVRLGIERHNGDGFCHAWVHMDLTTLIVAVISGKFGLEIHGPSCEQGPDSKIHMGVVVVVMVAVAVLVRVAVVVAVAVVMIGTRHSSQPDLDTLESELQVTFEAGVMPAGVSPYRPL
eukprot:CAMPEP_0115693474 /NCGR_PEP_ID=MMETSP0272-20121206/63741_1 /TAXON_ID=71861 /ORGANISM="Scrippsiella trochoidea, Strain CCMP3099" /LENGTH=117 /DNA_ID=CAMNT_0003133587 /DNA_START=114 /DNA_END=468 /DNA_ORIENTATION=+